MRLSQYIYYFFQSIKNRGFGFTLRLMWNEGKYERKLGIKTLSIKNLEGLTLVGEHAEDAHHYQGASYYILYELFSQLKTQHKGFVDMGCGKGRAMIVAADAGFKSVHGIDLAKELCEEAEENILKVRHRYPQTVFSVHHANAVSWEIPKGINTIYFFNPFPENVMTKVISNIKKSLREYPRVLEVIYVNPKFLDLFTSSGFTITYELKSKRYVEGVIMSAPELNH
jgi:hypothetical protein